jgi:hypothetical protein
MLRGEIAQRLEILCSCSDALDLGFASAPLLFLLQLSRAFAVLPAVCIYCWADFSSGLAWSPTGIRLR